MALIPVHCTRPGCGATRKTEYPNIPYTCPRHTDPSPVLSPARTMATAEATIAAQDSGPYWVSDHLPLPDRFITGLGYRADARQLPLGTRLRVTVHIDLPDDRPGLEDALAAVEAHIASKEPWTTRPWRWAVDVARRGPSSAEEAVHAEWMLRQVASRPCGGNSELPSHLARIADHIAEQADRAAPAPDGHEESPEPREEGDTPVLPDHELLTVQEVADHYRLSNMTVYRAIQDGRLPAVKIGRGCRIRAEDAHQFGVATTAGPR